MASSKAAAPQDLPAVLTERLQPHVAAPQKKLLAHFIRCLFDHASRLDMEAYEMTDLAGLTVSAWRHVTKWDGRAAKVQVFNPNVEEHEWQSSHTAVLILTRDLSFTLDSVRIALNRMGVNVHNLFHADYCAQRDKNGDLKDFTEQPTEHNELMMYFEVDHRSDAKQRREIERELLQVLADVELAVDDFKKITDAALTAQKDIQALAKAGLAKDDIDEASVFLDWLTNDHFTFLGYDEFVVDKGAVKVVADSALGLFRKTRSATAETVADMEKQLVAALQGEGIVTFIKSGRRASVHRPAYNDYVIVRQFDSKGNVVGGRRFLGLYTSSVYNDSPRSIPIIRKKIKTVLAASKFVDGSHNYKELAQILHTFPRDELILSTVDELLKTTRAVLSIQERKQIRVFVREDVYGQFVTALVYLPREIFNTEIRMQIHDVLAEYMDVEGSDFTNYLSESVLARIRYVFKLEKPLKKSLDVAEIERKVVALARQWTDELQTSLVEAAGEEKGMAYFAAYRDAFPSSYREEYSARVAVADVQRMESLFDDPDNQLTLSFYLSQEPSGSSLKLKIFHQETELMLSDLVPVLENLGLRAVEEIPYEIRRADGQCVYVYDFTLIYEADPELDPSSLRDIFHDAFVNIWYGRAENDLYNQMILGSKLTWREVAMLRAYARYMKQIRFGFSQEYIAHTLIQHARLTETLTFLFSSRFNPVRKKRAELQEKYIAKMEEGLEQVQNLNEDRILRKYMELMLATLRTNFYQEDPATKARKSYFSFKMNPSLINDMPLPRPKFEIFVYSPRVEGVHLRGGKVARGGLRWSDRIEDFRTEVLGLVKAQQVKNAVIVPVGAKGGFVAKQLPTSGDRDAMLQEGIACYKTFIQGLLDITDNLGQGDVIPPKDVIRHDADDPYLVVAADKGTATFSDIANEVAGKYDFWLGDAFASGGSNGYDHKKMGITARGAWVSVQRHFREMGINVQEEPITVVGIGDMAGDVFGNGLLRSKSVKLVAAFNHLHIFLDPDPDPAASFAERQRLFDLPRSSWEDYNAKLISKGGGIFNRSAKSIKLTPEIKKLLSVSKDQMTPTELIHNILKAPVDLIWNGGIGTYAKASTESHADVGDKANDALRVDGKDLRCKVIGEGGNLGFTQLSRVEFGLKGGRCYTDFIDNAGGVDCSDHEVNIKILLDELVKSGDLTSKHRNQWMLKMTEEVGNQVLANNYKQTQAISLAAREAAHRVEEYRRQINAFEAAGKLNRALEYLPDDEMISDRKAAGQGLVMPELAILISYSKGDLKEALIKQKAGDDPYLVNEVYGAFPATLVQEFGKHIKNHRLKGEIVATQVANDLFNHMGINFVHRLSESTGASELDIARAYIAARDIFDLKGLWAQIEALDYSVDGKLQQAMMARTARMVRRATRALIKANRLNFDVAAVVKRFKEPVAAFANDIPKYLHGEMAQNFNDAVREYQAAGVSQKLAHQVAVSDHLYHALGIIGAATDLSVPVNRVAEAFFILGERLSLNQFAGQLNNLSVSTHWQAMAREALRDDLEWQQQRLTQSVLNVQGKESLAQLLDQWSDTHRLLVDRWLRIVREILATTDPEFSMYSVAIRELVDLSQATSMAS